jgi:hypothetical protein
VGGDNDRKVKKLCIYTKPTNYKKRLEDTTSFFDFFARGRWETFSDAQDIARLRDFFSTYCHYDCANQNIDKLVRQTLTRIMAFDTAN